MKTILFVPGFVCDTMSPIEQMSIELSRYASKKFRIIWLTSPIQHSSSRFKRDNSRSTLTKALYADKLEEYDIEFFEHGFSKFNIVTNIFKLWKIFRKYRVDIVFTQFGFERFYCAFIGKLFGKKVVWYEHWFSLSTKFIFPKKIFYRIFVDQFIAISKDIADSLPSKKRVELIYNGYSIATFPHMDITTKNQIKQTLNLDGFKTIVLMTAAFRPEKRHDLAVQVAEKVIMANPDVAFVFLGNGECLETTELDIKKRGIDKNVIFPGHILKTSDYYCAADIFILTSEKEPFGFCLLEAMNYRLPIVCFNAGGAREILSSKNALLVEPLSEDDFADNIKLLISDNEMRSDLGNKGYAELIKYDMEKWKEKMTNVFETIK